MLGQVTFFRRRGTMVLVADCGIFRLADTLDMDLLCASQLSAVVTLSDWTTFLFNFIEGAI